MKSSGVSKVWSYTVEKHMKVEFVVVDVVKDSERSSWSSAPPGIRALGTNQPG